MKKIGVFFGLFYCSLFFGQKEHLSSFNAITLNYKFHLQFFLFLEGQMRGNEDYYSPDYYEIKGGIGYIASNNNKPFIGIGRFANYKNKELSREEFRIWLQEVFVFNQGSVKFENRFRAEQSWFYEPITDFHSKRTRLRYRLNISLPLNSKKIEAGTLFVNAYDEIFFITTKPTFTRNRIYGGFGYQLSEIFGITSGYLWQRDFLATNNRNVHYLYFGLNISIDGTKNRKPTDHFPGAD